MFQLISLVALLLMAVPLAHLLLLALASARGASRIGDESREPSSRFIIAIAAHDEAKVIGKTVTQLRKSDYPRELVEIHVVADHCADDTAQIASGAGGIVHERAEGRRTGKGAALSWLFRRILTKDSYDAVVIFDADTFVERSFLRVMEERLTRGEKVIQGRHVISNPEDGWFPALTWAMFLIDNRFQNLGRWNLGWSAKNMGDSICFQADVLRRYGWGQGLTEDYDLRQRLLLEGIKITYTPYAIGYGEAPTTWQQAMPQRIRWLRGARESSRKFARRLLKEGLRQLNGALLDGAAQAYLPSYSTMSMLAASAVVIQVAVNRFLEPNFSPLLVGAWLAVFCVLSAYPLIGLAFERAPMKAYVAISAGPFLIVLRTLLALGARFGSKPAKWVRTAHGVTE